MRLLLAEDEKELSRALCAILKHSGYTVDAVYDGEEAVEYALAEEYDGLLLDVMMPKKDGFEVLKTLRKENVNTPALFLTAKSAVEDRIEGLDIGADDYITKPFDKGELLARIRAMTRRKADFSPSDLSFSDLVLKRASGELEANGNAIKLANKEFQMLEMLMESPGRVISPDLFMERIWADAEAEESVIWVNISNLRKKLSQLGSKASIRARRGLGYSMEE